MSKLNGKIPETEAARLCERYGQDQVIVVTWNATNNDIQIVGAGSNEDNLRQAMGFGRQMGDMLLQRAKRVLSASSGDRPGEPWH